MQKITLPIEIVELEEGNFHVMIKAQFSDSMPGKWVIDTGASRSVFDNSLEKYFKTIENDPRDEVLSAGIGIGTLESRTGIIRNIQFGDLKIKKLRVALIDLSHINDLYAKYNSAKICGLIGSDFLNKYKAVIDYANKKLILEK